MTKKGEWNRGERRDRGRLKRTTPPPNLAATSPLLLCLPAQARLGLSTTGQEGRTRNEQRPPLFIPSPLSNCSFSLTFSLSVCLFPGSCSYSTILGFASLSLVFCRTPLSFSLCIVFARMFHSNFVREPVPILVCLEGRWLLFRFAGHAHALGMN